MAKVRNFDTGYAIICPGCSQEHQIGKSWSFNGNFDSPTFSPSLLVRSGHYADSINSCWCDYNKERIESGRELSVFKCFQCHSFIRDGKIIFLDDCTHELAGKTVDLPDYENKEV